MENATQIICQYAAGSAIRAPYQSAPIRVADFKPHLLEHSVPQLSSLPPHPSVARRNI
jgi:hypothetical protein